MEEHDKPQFSSVLQSILRLWPPFKPVGPVGNNSTTIPPQRLPAGASHDQRRDGICCTGMEFVCSFITTLIFLGPLYYFAAVVFKNTSDPIEFRVDSFSVSRLNITNNQISGHWTIGLSLTNPNKYVKVSYEEFEASLFYTSADEFLSSSNLTSFIQGPKNQTLVYVKPVAWLKGLNNFVADSIAEDTSIHGIVDFDIKLRVKAKYVFRMEDDPEYVFDMVCKGVQVKFSSSSSTENGTGDAVVIPELTQDVRQLPISS